MGQSCQETDEGRRPHGPDLHGVEDWLEVREGLAQPRHKAPRHGEEGWKTGGVESSRDRRCEESPAPPQASCLSRQTIKGRERGKGPLVPTAVGDTEATSQASRLCRGPLVGPDTTAVQRKAT